MPDFQSFPPSFIHRSETLRSGWLSNSTTHRRLAGILFFGDRNLAAGLEHSFKGSSEVHYEGTIYFPTTDVLFSGNGASATSSPYSFFIARRFEFTGNGEISINANYDASTVPIPPRVGPERQGLVK